MAFAIEAIFSRVLPGRNLITGVKLPGLFSRYPCRPLPLESVRIIKYVWLDDDDMMGDLNVY